MKLTKKCQPNNLFSDELKIFRTFFLIIIAFVLSVFSMIKNYIRSVIYESKNMLFTGTQTFGIIRLF
jgi:hypothetical protein